MTAPLNVEVTGREDWTTETFSIRTNAGTKEVVGSVRGWFGVHRRHRNSFVLTHLPTGAMLGVAPTEGLVIRAAGSIKGLGDWSADVATIQRSAEVIRAILLSHGVTQPADAPLWKGEDA